MDTQIPESSTLPDPEIPSTDISEPSVVVPMQSSGTIAPIMQRVTPPEVHPHQ